MGSKVSPLLFFELLQDKMPHWLGYLPVVLPSYMEELRGFKLVGFFLNSQNESGKSAIRWNGWIIHKSCNDG